MRFTFMMAKNLIVHALIQFHAQIVHLAWSATARVLGMTPHEVACNQVLAAKRDVSSVPSLRVLYIGGGAPKPRAKLGIWDAR